MTRNLQLRNLLLVSVALVLVALVLGISIGYGISPVTTRTTTLTLPTTLTETSPTTMTQVVPTTITVNSFSSQTFTVYTITEQAVLVFVYVPECVTTSGQTSTTYVNPPVGQTTTITYISPSGITYSGAVSFTTVTNNTNTGSDRTQSESISC